MEQSLASADPSLAICRYDDDALDARGHNAGEGPDLGRMVELDSLCADVRTAAEVCKGLSPDLTVVNETRVRLHLADVDCFAFRKQAADLVDGLEQRFRSEGTVGTWCSEAFGRYGPQGSGL